jgi:hypothetical protein
LKKIKKSWGNEKLGSGRKVSDKFFANSFRWKKGMIKDMNDHRNESDV